MPQQSNTETTTDDHRYSDICGASNRNGDPCELPAGWGTPGSGGDRCKFHGGCSTGPKDTSYLENNNHAVDNDGGPPEGNRNAAVHGGFTEWQNAYERITANGDSDTQARLETLKESYLSTAAENAPDVPTDRRKELARELATIKILKQRAQSDVWGEFEESTDTESRGLVLKGDDENQKVNPAHTAANRRRRRSREIARELRLWPAFQN